MIGRTLGGTTVAVIQGLIVLGVSYFVGFRLESFGSFLLALLFMFLISLLFASLGGAIASVLDDMQGFQLIMNFLVMPLFFLSGAIFPMQDLPKFLTVIVRANPLSYGVDGLRGALVNGYHFGLGVDLIVLTLVSAGLLALGSYLFSKVQV